MATAVEPYAGTWKLDPAHSTIQFAVRHQGMIPFRATFDDVEARLTAGTSGIGLEGRARVESVSIGVDIAHTYVSDLRVEVASPSGTPVTLHARSGGSADDIVGIAVVATARDGGVIR